MMSRLIFLILISSVISIDEKCNDNIFILITNKTIFLLNFNSENNSSPSIIYQIKSNQIIENGLFNKQTNTIILLLNHLNQTYSILSLNTYDNIYNYWIEKSNNIFYSSFIYLSLSQYYLYILNKQTMLLQTFILPLTSTIFKENYLVNLPKNQTILNYVIDENIHFLWILFENIQYQLYICDLNIYSCHLFMNILNLNKPIQLNINWKSQQLFIYSIDYLIIFQYNQNQTDYSIHRLNSTKQNQNQFLTICEKNNQIEYIFINYTYQRQVCFQTCHYLPLILNDTSPIHTIQRFAISSNILSCAKQRQISKIVIIILILTDIAMTLGVIAWYTYKYFYQTKLNNHKKQMSNETISSIEKDFITHF